MDGSWRWAYDADETNMRGENAIKAYKTAFAEAYASAVRDCLHGRDVDFSACETEFRRQLSNRGFTFVPADSTHN